MNGRTASSVKEAARTLGLIASALLRKWPLLESACRGVKVGRLTRFVEAMSKTWLPAWSRGIASTLGGGDVHA
jgi:hypothetical protein